MEILKYFFAKHIEKCRNKLNEINTDAEELKKNMLIKQMSF